MKNSVEKIADTKSSKENTKNRFEVIKKLVDSKQVDDLLSCLEELKPDAVKIGSGGNAEVFALSEGKLASACLKKIKPIQKLIVNDLETEFLMQIRVNELGVKTPLTLAVVKNNETKEEFFLMQRIFGISLEDAMHRYAKIPKAFNFKIFFEKLENQIKIMHEANIHHRDLHAGNVMINEQGDPVIIDFGTATRVFASDENPYTDSATILDESTGKYEAVKGYFKKDLVKFESLKRSMQEHLELLT